MPGSACRRSSVSPPTDTRSTTSSTVKPRTFFPPPTSRSTVVPEPLPPPSAAGSGCRSARHPSTTVTSVPRTLTTPATTGGAPGIRVGSNHGTISRTRSASAAQTRPPTRNSSSRTTPVSLIRSEEAKILQGVALSKQIRIGGRFPQRWNEIGGPFGAQVEPRAAHRMGEREPGRVQQLPRRERLEALGRLPLGRRDAPAAAEGVLPVAHDRVSHVRQMHADLVGAPGAERHAQQVGLREPRGHPHVRDRVAPPREHRHALAIRGMARDRRLDVHGALRKVAPGEGRVHTLDLAPLDHAREAAVREVGLRDEQQTRGVAIEAVYDPGPPFGGTLCERGAAFHEHVDQCVVPVTGAGVDDQTRRLVEHRQVLVFVSEGEVAVGGGVALGRRCIGRQLDGHDGAALELDRGAKRAAVAGDAFVGDDAGGDGAGQREQAPRHSPNAAHWLYTRRSWTYSPITWTGRWRASRDSARSLVTKSAATTAPAVVQNSRRLAALSIFFLRLALDAQPGMGQRVESLESDLLAALLALAEFLRRLEQPPQGLVHVPEVAPLLRGEQEGLLALHGVGALIRHMERVARQVAVGRLQAGVEGLVVVAELLHHPSALLVETLLQVGQLLLAQAALGRLGFGLRLGFRRHYRVPPFRPSCRRSAMVTRRASMSTSRVTSASSSTAPRTSLRASVSPSTNPWKADTAATISSAPATLSSMRVVYS